MPDDNKLAAMRYQGVKVAKCCQNCTFWYTPDGRDNPWGRCELGTFTHKKHNVEPQDLPTHETMVCDQWAGQALLRRGIGEYLDLLGHSDGEPGYCAADVGEVDDA